MGPRLTYRGPKTYLQEEACLWKRRGFTVLSYTKALSRVPCRSNSCTWRSKVTWGQNYWSRNGKGGKCPVTKCTIVMSAVNSDDFDSFIAFASQLIFVLHDCLNPIGGAPKRQRQVIVYVLERTFLWSVTHCGSIMDSLPEVQKKDIAPAPSSFFQFLYNLKIKFL